MSFYVELKSHKKKMDQVYLGTILSSEHEYISGIQEILSS